MEPVNHQFRSCPMKKLVGRGNIISKGTVIRKNMPPLRTGQWSGIYDLKIECLWNYFIRNFCSKVRPYQEASWVQKVRDSDQDTNSWRPQCWWMKWQDVKGSDSPELTQSAHHSRGEKQIFRRCSLRKPSW